jgi:hypothetical protein
MKQPRARRRIVIAVILQEPAPLVDARPEEEEVALERLPALG